MLSCVLMSMQPETANTTLQGPEASRRVPAHIAAATSCSMTAMPNSAWKGWEVSDKVAAAKITDQSWMGSNVCCNI